MNGTVTRLPTARRRRVRQRGEFLRDEGNVAAVRVLTRLDMTPARTLAQAQDADLTEVVVIGFDEAGDPFFASSRADGGAVLWLLELAKKALMEVEG
ncbi:hypothetical protein [Methylobacterium isbiliense]|jgi:hypothetical protein|uniref:Uncharacterized protein n=1 Tax=Methylobacterium isbiliense TaxID=315478 RepID=A0ABQ4SBZ2_9HYPH|nr:hypothetical protein [Methylobacterium isbiliense]MDN3622597.1 hypothetical protein [Methylobacterium isbiliense]GJE00554.1 hypothetical protein GMJLKIPL_2477 [Methylobacterium isbiliense]